jgi:hypothetical protein
MAAGMAVARTRTSIAHSRQRTQQTPHTRSAHGTSKQSRARAASYDGLALLLMTLSPPSAVPFSRPQERERERSVSFEVTGLPPTTRCALRSSDCFVKQKKQLVLGQGSRPSSHRARSASCVGRAVCVCVCECRPRAGIKHSHPWPR